jgi:dTDP-4-dehydrorhamnose reductase
MDALKIYMAGCGGMLGDAFYNVFKRGNSLICSDKNPTNSWQSKLDFTTYETYRRAVLEAAPDWLFHIGAETDLEVCENDEAYSFSTNSESVSYAVEISNELNIPLLYISTAGIFSGDKEFFSEKSNDQKFYN